MKKRTGRRQLAILVSLFGLLGQPAVNAAEPGRSAETEREVLARVIHELRAIKALVAKADQRKLSGTRVSFDYSQLLAELSVVSEGIEEYISGTRLQPRTFEPLGAHYTEVKTQSTEGAKP